MSDTPTPETPNPTPDARPAEGSPAPWLAAAVTVVLTAAFLVAVALLWDAADSAADLTWARRTYLLTGIEALTFTAVGWLFGREVHRVRAEKAEAGEAAADARAQEATEQAAEATALTADLKATGGALRSAVESMSASRGAVPSDMLSSREAGPSSADLELLRAIALRFPD